jgi:hypothetical protein
MSSRHCLTLLIVAALTFFSLPASAWDGIPLWYGTAHGASPGGGGIVGTGGLSESSIECVHCHMKPEKKIDATVTPVPAFGAGTSYAPGQKYQFTVKLVGEHLGLAQCDQYMANNNGFAATFENASGQNVGSLASDSGQVQGSACPKDPPKGDTLTGTTVMYDDCRVILPRTDGVSLPNVTQWKFSWTAPPRGAGDVVMYAGVVDGNCDMSSLNDDAKMIKLTLSESAATVMNTPAFLGGASSSRLPWWLTSAFVAAVGIVLTSKKRPS